MALSKTFGQGKGIRSGHKPNDKIFTPYHISKLIIDKFNLDGKVLDPFMGVVHFMTSFQLMSKKIGVK